MTFGVVLLAAGASSRMGRPKLLLPWGELSVLEHLIRQWHALGAAQIGVVCAERDDKLPVEVVRTGLPNLMPIPNLHPEEGMFSSIRCAARWRAWRAAITHWVIALGDQPQIRSDTLRALIDFGCAHPDRICQPRQGNRLRHPVWLPRTVFELLANSPAEHLRAFLAQEPTDVLGCPVRDPGLECDLDTPEDYASALRRFRPDCC